MRTIDDNNRMIHLATQVISELGITAESLTDLALKLKLSFLINVPDNTSIYLIGTKLRKLPTTFVEAARQATHTDQDTPLEVNPEVDFLCLEASDYNAIIQRGELRKKEFTSVAILDEYRQGITYLSTNQYAKRYVTNNEHPVYIEGAFYSHIQQNKTNKPLLEKSITIRLDDILISSKSLQAIKKEILNKEPVYEKFKIEIWTSTMLAQLNEASTYFLSGESNNVENSQLRNEIKKWLDLKWTEGGKDLLEQAANAILPDDLYKSSPPRETVNEHLRSLYNSYASTALILINEKAKECWQEMESSTHKKFPKRDSIKKDLKDNSRLSAKLVDAAATIIRPDAKK